MIAVGIAVVFVGGHDAEAAVAGLEDDDRDHERGGEAEGEGVSVVEGHCSGSCLEAEDHPPLTGARCVRTERCNHRAGEAAAAARSRSRPFTG